MLYDTVHYISFPGKTLLAKAVANQTSATFLRVVGSELIQKYLGDGPKLVRELFRVAEEHAPSIVFIDEIDAVGTKRYESNSGVYGNYSNTPPPLSLHPHSLPQPFQPPSTPFPQFPKIEDAPTIVFIDVLGIKLDSIIDLIEVSSNITLPPINAPP